jgi:adenine-specific DNA-methyltransferase
MDRSRCGRKSRRVSIAWFALAYYGDGSCKLIGDHMPILSWLTRDRDVQAADAVPYRLLERDDTLSAGDTSSGNMLIQGDNLEALKSLLPYFRGQVKCIYIDPPYNTDAAVGDMFEDNFSHSQWLGIMWPRLELLEEILSEDGLFICSIDDKESAYLTVVLDEIFGRDNRINTVAVKMSEASGVKMAHADKRLPKLKEWLLIYGKRNRPKFNIDLIPPEKWNEEYKTVITGNSRDEINRLKDLISKQPATQADVEECQKILATCRMQSMSNFCRQNHIDDSNLDGWRFENSWRIVQAVGSSSVYNLALRSKKSGGDISAGLSSTGLERFSINLDHIRMS